MHLYTKVLYCALLKLVSTFLLINLIFFPLFFFKQLCSSLRLLPHDYQNYKSILIKEYEKQGSLRLAQARTLIRIDVNKTRKMYNFFVEQGWVKQPDG